MSHVVSNLSEYKQYVENDLDRIQHCLLAVTKAYNIGRVPRWLLGFATDKFLILTDNWEEKDRSSANTDNDVKIALEFNEDSGRPTALTWITDDVICVGFETGVIVCFDCEGEEIFEYKGQDSEVQSIRVESEANNGNNESILWVLYENGYLVSIPVAEVLESSNNETNAGAIDKLSVFKLSDHNSVSDFVFYCPNYATIQSVDALFDIQGTEEKGDQEDSSTPSHQTKNIVFVAGMNSAISLYKLDEEQLHFQDFDKLVGYAKDKVGSILSKSFMSFFSMGSSTAKSASSSSSRARGSSSTSSTGTASDGTSQNSYDTVVATEEKAKTVLSMLDFQDEKRRILRVSADPMRHLVAAADGLGRVTLFDSQTNCIIRLWKGLRDARLAWTYSPASTGLESNRSGSVGDKTAKRLCLAIYAPLVGLVSIFEMRHGPCLRIIPVGMHCQLFTIIRDSHTETDNDNDNDQDWDACGALDTGHCISTTTEARCYIFRRIPDTSSVEIFEIDPTGRLETDVDTSVLGAEGGAEEETEALTATLEGGTTVHSASAANTGHPTIPSFGNSESSLWSESPEPPDETTALRLAQSTCVVLVTRCLTIRLGLTIPYHKIGVTDQQDRSKRGTPNAAAAGQGGLGAHKVSPEQLMSCRFSKEEMNLIEGAEERIIYLLSSKKGGSSWTLSVSGAVEFMTVVECVELYGRTSAPLEADESSVPKGMEVVFSASFHKRLGELLHKALSTTAPESAVESVGEEKEDHVHEQILNLRKLELEYRCRLLALYEAFCLLRGPGPDSDHPSTTTTTTTATATTTPGEQSLFTPTAEIIPHRANSASPFPSPFPSNLTSMDTSELFSLTPPLQAAHTPQSLVLGAYGAGTVRIAEDVAAICRQNTARGEALCWALRAAKKIEKSKSKSHPPSGRRQSTMGTPSNMNSVDERGLGDAYGSPARETNRSNYISISGSRSSVSSPLLMQKIMTPAEKTSLSQSADSMTSSSSKSNHRVSIQSCFGYGFGRQSRMDGRTQPHFSISFSVFRAFVQHRQSHSHSHMWGSTGEEGIAASSINAISANPYALRTQDLIEFVQLADKAAQSNYHHRKKIPAIDPTEYLTFPPTFVPLRIITPELSAKSVPHLSWTPMGYQAYDALSFIIVPLLEDIFNLNSYVSVIKQLGLPTGSEALGKLTLLFFSYIERNSVSYLISEILTKKITSSPFQRWLRETLLTFQDDLSAFAKVMKREQEPPSPSSPHSPTPGMNNNLNSDLQEEEEEEEEELFQSPSSPSSTKDASIDNMTESPYYSSRQLAVLVREIIAHRPSENDADEDSTASSRGAQNSPFTGQRNHKINDTSKNEEFPSFDECVSFVLAPALQLASRSHNLEAVMTMAAVIVETLYSVNDQIERRTYGASNLKATIFAWQTLQRQARIALLLSSRVGVEPTAFSVESLDKGQVSLHRLLAADTLCFAASAEQAKDHEERCREVYKNRMAGSTSSAALSAAAATTAATAAASAAAAMSASSSLFRRASTSSAPSPPPPDFNPNVQDRTNLMDHARASLKGLSSSLPSSSQSVLLAWGAAADKRWRDLMALAVSEDLFCDSLGSSEGDQGNVTTASGQRKKVSTNAARKRKPMLLYFPHHSQLRYLGAYRSIMVAERWIKKVQNVSLLASVSDHLSNLPVFQRSVVAAFIYREHVFPFIKMLLELEDPIFSGPDAHAQVNTQLNHQLLQMIASVDLTKTFVKSTIEILSYIETGLIAFMNEKDGNKAYLSDFFSDLSIQDTDIDSSIWPSPHDPILEKLYRTTLRDLEAFHTSDHDDSIQKPLYAYRSNRPSGSHGSRTRGHKSSIWSVQEIREHMSVLWVMLLRFQCGLRGVKPTTILGKEFLKEFLLFNADIEEYATRTAAFEIPAVDEEHDLAIQSMRREFMNQSFQRLVSIEPATPVYNLAHLWGLDPDQVRMLHISVLLGRGSQDEEVEAMLSLFAPASCNSLIDTVIQALRKRIGGVLLRIERLPTFGPAIATMDSEAVNWALRSVFGQVGTLTHPSSSGYSSPRGRGSDHPREDLEGRSYFAPTPASSYVINIATGKARTVNINLPSTRHLVIVLQGMLLSIPIQDRKGNDRDRENRDKDEAEADEVVYEDNRSSSWLERKKKCDALLSLCSSFGLLPQV